MSRITVYSKDGDFIGDIRAATLRSYTLAASGVLGQCQWDMSRRDPNTSLKYLEYGKYILVRDGTFPDWAGIIYPPRQWGVGMVTVTAYQLEKVLEWRKTPVEKINNTAGELFKQILNLTNVSPYNEKPITPNNIFAGGAATDEQLGNNAYAHIQAIAERTGYDFDVTHDFDVNGRLYLKGNWYERKGVETQKTFTEGYNIGLSNSILQEQGDLFNDVTGYSDASTAGSRLVSTAINTDAIAKYGLYQTSKVFTGVTQQAVLDNGVINELKKTFEPGRVVDVTCVDFGDDIYSFIRLGNIFNMKLSTAGFENGGFGLHTKVRVHGIEIDDLKGYPRLVVEVLNA